MKTLHPLCFLTIFLSFFNSPILAQKLKDNFNVTVKQYNDKIKIVNNNLHTVSVTVFLEGSEKQYIIKPSDFKTVIPKHFLTRKIVRNTTINVEYNERCFQIDAASSFERMLNSIDHYHSLKIELSVNDVAQGKIDTTNIGTIAKNTIDYLLYEEFKSLTHKIAKIESSQKRIARILMLKKSSERIGVKRSRAINTSEVKSFLKDDLTDEYSFNDEVEIGYIIEHLERRKYFSSVLMINSNTHELGTLDSLGFTLFPDIKTRKLELSFSAGRSDGNKDDEYDGSSSYEVFSSRNIELEFSQEYFKARVSKTTMLEANLKVGYLYNSHYRRNDTMLINNQKVIIEKTSVKLHNVTIGTELLIRSVTEGISPGLSIEGGLTYNLSSSIQTTPDIITSDDEKGLGYYCGAQVTYGNRWNVAIGGRYYNFGITNKDINRDRLNATLLRIGLSFRF